MYAEGRERRIGRMDTQARESRCRIHGQRRERHTGKGRPYRDEQMDIQGTKEPRRRRKGGKEKTLKKKVM